MTRHCQKLNTLCLGLTVINHYEQLKHKPNVLDWHCMLKHASFIAQYGELSVARLHGSLSVLCGEDTCIKARGMLGGVLHCLSSQQDWLKGRVPLQAMLPSDASVCL